MSRQITSLLLIKRNVARKANYLASEIYPEVGSFLHERFVTIADLLATIHNAVEEVMSDTGQVIEGDKMQWMARFIYSFGKEVTARLTHELNIEAVPQVEALREIFHDMVLGIFDYP
jgi:hypothetical protein